MKAVKINNKMYLFERQDSNIDPMLYLDIYSMLQNKKMVGETLYVTKEL